MVVEDCICIPYGTTPKYVNYPILKYIRKKTIIDKINNVEPIAYMARREGWACDVYKFENFYISTGYAPFGKSLDYSFLKKFDDKARAILSNNFGFEGWDADTYDKRHAARKKELARLLKKFEESVLQEVGAR